MKILFSGALLFVALFSFFGAAGFMKFETLKLQAIGKESLEFFMFLLIVLTGTRGLLASRQTKDLFRLAGGMAALAEAAYVSISGSFLGWIVGISLFALVDGKTKDVALGIFLFIYMFILSSAPLMWRKQIENQALEFIEFRIKRRRFKYIFRTLCLFLISLGVWGLDQLFNK